MLTFEWDPIKAEQNLAKHRIDFIDAVRVFEGDHLVYRSDQRGEERYVAVGSVNDRIAAVVWTPRGPDIRRIISARRARHVEEEQFRQSQRQGP